VEGALRTTDAELCIRQATPTGVGEEIAEIERRALGHRPEAAADVHQQGIGNLLQLVTQDEAANPQFRDHEPELRAQLLKREVLRAREEGTLIDLAVDADAKAEVEGSGCGRTSLGAGAGGVNVGHERFLSARPKVACEEPHAGATGGVKGEASRSEVRSEAQDP
jgi:hypothetical protein